MKAKDVIKGVVPPFILTAYRRAKRSPPARVFQGDGQDLKLYWDPHFADVLETWGEGNAWVELPLIFAALNGKVVDIACGTGRTMEILGANKNLEVHGCDISDLLIGRAKARGISENHLVVCDATRMPYVDGAFKYGYSIGSLEHFTEDGIWQFLSECRRVVSHATFHQHPTSRSGKNEGWITTTQSYHNNSVDWWLKFYRSVYESVTVHDSVWQDEISLGRWFVCQ